MITRHRKRSRVLVAVLLSVIVIFAISAIALYALYPKDPQIAYSYQSFNLDKSDAKLDCGNAKRGAIGTLEYGVYLTCGDDEMQSIASMTKVITCLVILGAIGDNLDELQKPITLDALAVQEWQNAYNNNGSNVRIAEGETVTKEQMLYAIMLASANNLAETFARIQFGSFDNYKLKAEEFLRENELTHTIIGNDASGFDDSTRSNSTDMIKVGALALQNPLLAKIVSTADYEFPSSLGGTEIEHNTNLLLRSGFSGIKTGHTDDAGHCILFAKKMKITNSENELTVIGVVMEENERDGIFNDAINYTSELSKLIYHTTLINSGETVATLTYSNGLSVDFTTDTDLSADIFAGTEHDISVEYNENNSSIILKYDGNITTANLPPCNALDFGINFVGYLMHKYEQPYC